MLCCPKSATARFPPVVAANARLPADNSRPTDHPGWCVFWNSRANSPFHYPTVPNTLSHAANPSNTNPNRHASSGCHQHYSFRHTKAAVAAAMRYHCQDGLLSNLLAIGYGPPKRRSPQEMAPLLSTCCSAQSNRYHSNATPVAPPVAAVRAVVPLAVAAVAAEVVGASPNRGWCVAAAAVDVAAEIAVVVAAAVVDPDMWASSPALMACCTAT